MPTRAWLGLLLAGVLGLACAEPEPAVIDWKASSRAERVEHLERLLEEAWADLRRAQTPDTWEEANDRAVSALSLLRTELWQQDRARFMGLEARAEQVSSDTRAAVGL